MVLAVLAGVLSAPGKGKVPGQTSGGIFEKVKNTAGTVVKYGTGGVAMGAGGAMVGASIPAKDSVVEVNHKGLPAGGAVKEKDNSWVSIVLVIIFAVIIMMGVCCCCCCCSVGVYYNARKKEDGK